MWNRRDGTHFEDRTMKLKAKMVPHSSVVGSSISVQDETGKMVALLTILVPNPDLDYKTTAKTVSDTICAALKG